MSNELISARLGDYTLCFNQDNGAWISLNYRERPLLENSSGLAEITLTIDGVTTVATGRVNLDNIRNAILVGAGLRRTIWICMSFSMW